MFKYIKERFFPKKTEPFITFNSAPTTIDGKIRIEMDWNDEFIMDARKRYGYKGTTDEEIVQQYLTDVIRMVEQKNKDRNGGNFA